MRVPRALIVEGRRGQADEAALVGRLVGPGVDRRGDVVDGDLEAVGVRAAIVVRDRNCDCVDAVVGVDMGARDGAVRSARRAWGPGRAFRHDAEVGRSPVPPRDRRSVGVGGALIVERGGREADRTAFVGRLVGPSVDRRGDVVDGHVERVARRGAVVVHDADGDRVSAVVGVYVGSADGAVRTARRARRPERGLGDKTGFGRRPVTPRDRRGVGVGGALVVERGRCKAQEVALVDRPVDPGVHRRSDVVDRHGQRVAARGAIVVGDGDLDRIRPVVCVDVGTGDRAVGAEH